MLELLLAAKAKPTAFALNFVKKADVPLAVYHSTLTSINGKLYQVGGIDVSGNGVSNHYCYDPALDTWTAKAALPAAAGGAMSCTYNGKLYVLGATTSAAKKLYCYDPTANAWTTLADCPATIQGEPSSGVVNDKLYVINNADDFVYVYTFASNTWASVAITRSNTQNRFVPGKVQVGNYIYTAYNDQFLRYDPINNVWLSLAAPPLATFYGVMLFYAKGKIYSIGGWKGSLIQDMYVYDLTANTWTLFVSNVTYAQYVNHVQAVNGVFYVMGGSSTGGNTGAQVGNYQLGM